MLTATSFTIAQPGNNQNLPGQEKVTNCNKFPQRIVTEQHAEGAINMLNNGDDSHRHYIGERSQKQESLTGTSIVYV